MFCSSGFLLFSLPLYTDKQINKSLHVRQISCTVSYATYHRIREDFLHYISSLECVPFKMLPREILSTKVLRDLIPHIWTLPVLQKSVCVTQILGVKLEVSYMRSHLSYEAGVRKRKFFFIWAKNFISVHLHITKREIKISDICWTCTSPRISHDKSNTSESCVS